MSKFRKALLFLWGLALLVTLASPWVWGVLAIEAGGGACILGTVELQYRTESTQGGIGHSGHGTGKTIMFAEGEIISHIVQVGANGSFEVCGVRDGSYTLSASAPGYLTAKTAGGAVVVDGAQVEVAPVELLGGDVFDLGGLGGVTIDDLLLVIDSSGQETQDCMNEKGELVDVFGCDGGVTVDDILAVVDNMGQGEFQVWVP